MSELDDRTHTVPTELTFEPPAPGRWELETAHHGLRPLSPFLRQAYQRAFEGRHRRTAGALRPPARDRGGQVRPRMPVHAPRWRSGSNPGPRRNLLHRRS